MVNPSAQPVKIYRRTRLADFEQVDHNIATFKLNDVEQANNSHPACPVSAEDGATQSDYSDLPDLSDSVLNDCDKVSFVIFLKDIVAYLPFQMIN